MIRAALPDRFLSLSVDILPQKREYERTSTTVINASLTPVVTRYLDRLEGYLTEGVSKDFESGAYVRFWDNRAYDEGVRRLYLRKVGMK